MAFTEMKARTSTHRVTKGSNRRENGSSYDLKFVPVGVGKRSAGGWYRELPHDEIEVMSRGQLKRVPLEHEDPEEKAKAVVRDIVRHKH